MWVHFVLYRVLLFDEITLGSHAHQRNNNKKTDIADRKHKTIMIQGLRSREFHRAIAPQSQFQIVVLVCIQFVAPSTATSEALSLLWNNEVIPGNIFMMNIFQVSYLLEEQFCLRLIILLVQGTSSSSIKLVGSHHSAGSKDHIQATNYFTRFPQYTIQYFNLSMNQHKKVDFQAVCLPYLWKMESPKPEVGELDQLQHLI